MTTTKLETKIATATAQAAQSMEYTREQIQFALDTLARDATKQAADLRASTDPGSVSSWVALTPELRELFNRFQVQRDAHRALVCIAKGA